MKKKVIAKVIIALCMISFLSAMLTGCDKDADDKSLYYWTLSEYETITNDYLELEGGVNIQVYKSYVYFINGLDAQEKNNQWGVPVKNTIVRAKPNRDGNFSDPEIIVPKHVLMKHEGGGFAILDDWIYYATPSIDAQGNIIGTHTDFMRTRVDANITQLLATVEGNDVKYYFDYTRVLYKRESGSSVQYIDFSAVDGSKSMNDGAGIVKGTLLENVEDVVWSYASKYIYYATNVGQDGNKFNNTINRIKKDGTDNKIIIDGSGFDEDVHFDLVDMRYFGSQGHIEYMASILNNGSKKQIGYYACEIADDNEFDLETQACVTKETDYKSIDVIYYTHNYGFATIAKHNNKIYSLNIRQDGISEELLFDEETTILSFDDSELYYIDNNDGKIHAKVFDLDFERVVVDKEISTDWSKVDFLFIGAGWFTKLPYIMYFDEKDNNPYIIPLQNVWSHKFENDQPIWETIPVYQIGI